MKTWLTTTAALEAGTGVALALAPSAVVLILLGSPLDSPAGLVIGRVLGAAVLAADPTSRSAARWQSWPRWRKRLQSEAALEVEVALDGACGDLVGSRILDLDTGAAQFLQQ